MQSASILIRPSAAADVHGIAAVYAWNVLNGTGTFETVPPDTAEMTRRRDDVVAKTLPWLVAERGGVLLGFAYANHFRPRPAYRYCLEDSVYLADEARGKGIGRLLLAELLARCEALGGRQMVAVIGDSQNLASIGVHAALGFEQTGLMKAAGWKFGRWLDVVLMQKQLGPGSAVAPSESTT